MGSLRTVVCHELSEIDFFFLRERKKIYLKKTETNLSRNHLWILAVEKAAWGQSSCVTLNMSVNFSELYLMNTQGQ